MNLSGNTILITGGSEGVGLALARQLIQRNTVIVCARDEEKLSQAAAGMPDLITYACDVTHPGRRKQLLAHLVTAYPELNILINNAGGKTPVDLATGAGAERALEADLALNFTAPVALTTELMPHLKSRPRAAVVNVTTGLVHLAKAEQAFYCAAKSALHAYTQALRWALQDSGVSVHEALLGVVDTAFHNGRLPADLPAMSAEAAAGAVLRGLQRGRGETYVGKAALARWLAFVAPNRGLAIVNGRG